MNALNIDTGLQTYKLNDACEVAFNPTDINFVEKLYNVFAELDSKQNDYVKRAENIGEDTEKMFQFAKERDKEMRVLIDDAFNVPVCEALFKDRNVFARAGNGIPVWANLLLAIIDECNVAEAELRKKSSATIDKYTKKYHR